MHPEKDKKAASLTEGSINNEVGRAFDTSETSQNTNTNKRDAIMSVDEYRKILKDYKSTDEKIIEKIRFMEALSRNVIRIELEKIRLSHQENKKENE